MKILVCVKQVPSVSHVEIDRKTNNLIREGVPSIVNPADKHAVEQALQLKEKFGGTVSILCMSTPDGIKSIKECIAMGADNGYLASDRAYGGSDTLATGYILSSCIKHIGEFDVIFTGTQAIDGDTGQVGPEVAELLGYSQITYVREVEAYEDKVIAYRDSNNGIEKVESSYPVVLTISREAQEPRKTTEEGLKRAEEVEIPVLDAATVGIDTDRSGRNGSATIIHNVFPPALLEKGTKIQEATEEESVKKLVSILLKENLIG